MSKKSFRKVSPNETETDPQYQREVNEARAAAMAEHFDHSLVGVVVLAEREDGSLVIVDGQHRWTAAKMAGLGDQKFLAEVHEGLTLEEEARLFLRLNGTRSAVGAYPKFRARVVSKEETAVAITNIARKLGLSISTSKSKNTVAAVDALDAVHRLGNLDATLRVAKLWGDGRSEFFDGPLLKGISSFLRSYPQVSTMDLAEKLGPHTAEKMKNRFLRTKESVGVSMPLAACIVLREVFNTKRRKDLLPPVDLQSKQQIAVKTA